MEHRSPKSDSGLSGLKVLVVEDEVLIGMMLEDMLTDLGCKVLGPSINIEEAVRAAQDPSVEVAILDLNLNGVSAMPIADILHSRRVPIVFSTGYGVAETTNETYKKFPTLSKPYDSADLKRILEQVVAR